MTEFFDQMGVGADKVGIKVFFDQHYSAFTSYLATLSWNKYSNDQLIPDDLDFDVQAFAHELIHQMDGLKQLVDDFTEEYYDDENQEMSVLDTSIQYRRVRDTERRVYISQGESIWKQGCRQ